MLRSAPPALLAALTLAGPAGADGCRLALVLALDVSSSVDAAEDRLQREGLARALLAPEVVQAFLTGDPVALYAFEWSGQRTQVPLWPGWVMVEDEATLRGLAAAVTGSARSTDELPTAVGAALAHAALRLREVPDCRARTIDVAGDGFHNEGFGPDLAYREFPFDGITVNALVVGGTEMDKELIRWFQSEVVRGQGSFLMVADGYEDYARAMERKLLRELGQPAVSGTPGGGDAG